LNGEVPSRVPESLGLDPELVDRVAERTVEWGTALSLSARDARNAHEAQQSLREAASLLAIGGSYRLLLDVTGAQEPLRMAAEHFRRLGNFFAHPLSVCAADTSAARAALDAPSGPLKAVDRAHVLLALGWVDVDARGAMIDAEARQLGGIERDVLFTHMSQAEPVAAAEVGRLRVPLDATMRVVQAADALAHEGREHMRGLVTHLHDFLLRAHDVTAAAARDRFHWAQLMSSVLPVEPEAAALGAVVMRAATRRELADELMERLDLPPQAVAPLEVAGSIVRAAG
jgi:hypothetical protein